MLGDFYNEGFVGFRAPSSGSTTDRNLPDILVGNGWNFYAIEAKSSDGDVVYIDGEEVDDLKVFANSFGAVPLIAVRFDYERWGFFYPEEMYKTEGGNYRTKKEDIEDSIEISDLI